MSGTLDAFALYLHIPFCRARCDYCDFFTRTRVPSSRQQAIVHRILEEAAVARDRWHQHEPALGSVYVGGGTPSALAPAAQEAFLSGLRSFLTSFPSVGRPGEVTVEVNPEDVTPHLLDRYRDTGVTRLSLGVQSLREPVLRRIGRHTTPTATRTGLETVAERWDGAWSADVITAIPGDTTTGAAADASAISRFGPRHMSVYELTIEPATVLGLRRRRGLLHDSPDEERGRVLAAVSAALATAGLQRYEVSNYAAPGAESAHNARYWRLGPWAGAGPGAVSLLPYRGRPTHGTGPRSFKRYLDAPDFAVIHEPLSLREFVEELLMGGLRTRAGVDAATFRVWVGKSLRNTVPRTIDRWARYWAVADDDRLALQWEGLDLVNRILVDAFVELEETIPSDAPPPRWPDAATPDNTAT